MAKNLKTEGSHTTEALRVLRLKIPVKSIQHIRDKAELILENSVDPASSLSSKNHGLLYGLIQSGKTGVINGTAAMALDNGFEILIILTSNINLLYTQTLGRVRQALRGVQVLGKDDWKQSGLFQKKLKNSPVVIVTSKDTNKLTSLTEELKKANIKPKAALIIDDEADHASLNTYASKRDAERISKINALITNLRAYLNRNTYLQVTATPQALFLQTPDHDYRPEFTVLSEPGQGYVGGEKFFGKGKKKVLRYVDLNEIEELTQKGAGSGKIPPGLRKSIVTFLVATAVKVIRGENIESSKPTGASFLCHVSYKKLDHDYIVDLIYEFIEHVQSSLNDSKSPNTEVVKDLKSAYLDLKGTEKNLPDFQIVLDKIAFYLPSAAVKAINSDSMKEVGLDTVYTLFVGGNKLGRGVTIENLLVSYYGRNPKTPNSDTVLQHARMYGYRSEDMGLTRLFLPEKLAQHFGIIHDMESSLRDLIKSHPPGQFEGLYIQPPVRATRPNVLVPNSIGVYVAGKSYNPQFPNTEIKIYSKLNSLLSDFSEGEHDVTIDFIIKLVKLCTPSAPKDAVLWDIKALASALLKIKSLKTNKAKLIIKQDRKLAKPRSETQGILTGGEISEAEGSLPTLFMLNNKTEVGEYWWPQLRLPDGNYAIAFSFNRK